MYVYNGEDLILNLPCEMWQGKTNTISDPGVGNSHAKKKKIPCSKSKRNTTRKGLSILCYEFIKIFIQMLKHNAGVILSRLVSRCIELSR